jgi:hypothetical protein
MIDTFLIRNSKARAASSHTVAEIGDSILISGKEENIPFVNSRGKVKLHVLLISPIGTIVDSNQVDLGETGLQRIYAFPVTPDMYSGTYVLQVDGDIKKREKINIKTDKQLLYRWVLFYGVNFSNPNNFPLNNFVLDVMIPPNISPIQQVTKVDCNFKPTTLISDKEGNRWLRFNFHQLSPKEEITLTYRAHIITRVVAYDLTRIRDFMESEHREIVKIATKYSNYPPVGKAFAFLRYIKNNIEFVPLEGDYGAAYAIENKYGDCTEFSTLFVSLCRAAGIPARMTTSIIKTELEGWQYHSQAEFFANGIWFPIDPTLHQDRRYLFRNPGCIILQRGNTQGESSVREVRYRFDKMEENPLTIHTHKEVVCDKTKVVGKINESLPQGAISSKGTLFDDVSWKFTLPSVDLEEQLKSIEIRATAPETSPVHKPFNIPVHLYNRNADEIIGTLRVSFIRGGIYTSHLYPMKLVANSHEPMMIEIPATNFLGRTLVEFIFQDENGGKIGYEQKRINFQ